MNSAEQLLSLPDADVLPMLQDNWRTHNARVAAHGAAEIETWTVPQLEGVCCKLHIMMRGRAEMIADIRKAIAGPKVTGSTTSDGPGSQPYRSQSDGPSDEEKEPSGEPSPPARQPHPRSPRARPSSSRLDAALSAALSRPLLSDSPRRGSSRERARVASAAHQRQADRQSMASPPRAREAPFRVASSRNRLSQRALLQDFATEEEEQPAAAASEEEDDADEDGMPLDADTLLRDIARGERRPYRDRPRADVEDEMDSAGLDRPFARAFLANVLRGSGGKSVAQVFRYDVDFGKDERSKNECWALARIADALLTRDWERALELTCRRLAGVHTASSSGNWAVCDALEMHHGRQSFVPGRVLQQALKSVVRGEALHKSAARPAASSSQPRRSASHGYSRREGDTDTFRSASDSKKGAGDQARRNQHSSQARGSDTK